MVSCVTFDVVKLHLSCWTCQEWTRAQLLPTTYACGQACVGSTEGSSSFARRSFCKFCKFCNTNAPNKIQKELGKDRPTLQSIQDIAITSSTGGGGGTETAEGDEGAENTGGGEDTENTGGGESAGSAGGGGSADNTGGGGNTSNDGNTAGDVERDITDERRSQY